MQAWEEFLLLQEKELGSTIVRKWLRPLKIVNFDACNLYLEASSSFQIHWFEEHVRKRALEVLFNNNRKIIKVHISISNGSFANTSKKKTKKKVEPAPVEAPTFSIAFDELDPQCLFQNYLPSEANLLPFKLLCRTSGYDPEAKRIIPGKTELGVFNPIYICGGKGVGKTHLLMAFTHALREQGKSVTYVRAETFTEHVVTAIRAGEMNLFRQSYRKTDVLVIEDVHIFARKSATQEELFHTFNALHVEGKQIVLSANCLPGEMQFVEPRLVSRFEWGIVTPMVLPNKDEMRAVLQTKAAAMRCHLQQQVIEFILEIFTSSCKAAVRALEALILRTHLNEASTGTANAGPITIPFARRLLTDLIEEEQQIALNPDKVIQHVTEHFGMRPEDILGKGQTRDCVLPRQMAMYFCRTQLKMPFVRVGELFSKDHSTVMSSVKLIQKGIDSNDDAIAFPYQAILKKLTS